MSRIGIGVITCGVREPRDLLAPSGATVIRYVDVERRGAAHARNQVLKALYDAGSDFIFMFDDDCYPIMPGWAECFIEQHRLTRYHFLGLPEAFKSRPLALRGEVMHWDTVIGCFSFQTRLFMERVGYYNAAYRGYGYEDAGRNARAVRSGLCGSLGYPSPLRSTSYILSEDVYDRNPVPNLTPEEKRVGMDANRPIWTAENLASQIYYPYTEV